MKIYDTHFESDYVSCEVFTDESFWISIGEKDLTGVHNMSTRITYEDFDKLVAYVNKERGQYQKADITVKDLNELRAENLRLKNKPHYTVEWTDNPPVLWKL